MRVKINRYTIFTEPSVLTSIFNLKYIKKNKIKNDSLNHMLWSFDNTLFLHIQEKIVLSFDKKKSTKNKTKKIGKYVNCI